MFVIFLQDITIDIKTQISRHRLKKDSSTRKLSLTLTDVQRHLIRLDIWQHYNLKILANLLKHKFFSCENVDLWIASEEKALLG